MNETRRYPIDCMALKKGDVITCEELSNITNELVGTDSYRLKVLSIKEFINFHRPELTVKSLRDSLKVLTDREATEYNDARVMVHLRGIGQSVSKLCAVDSTQLTEDETKKHMRRIEVNSRTYQAALMGRSGKIQLPPVERKTPGLITA